MAPWLNGFGILLVAIGTVMTLLTMMTTDGKVVGTWNEPIERAKLFPRDKRRTIIGCVLIGIGSALQMAGQFVTGDVSLLLEILKWIAIAFCIIGIPTLVGCAIKILYDGIIVYDAYREKDKPETEVKGFFTHKDKRQGTKENREYHLKNKKMNDPASWH